MSKYVKTFFFLILLVTEAIAQTGDFVREDHAEPNLLTIKELNSQGKYLEAILQSEENNNYKALGEVVSAAKSAWALSHITLARKYWELAVAHKDCFGVEKARVLLARGIMEHQEGNYEYARSLAEEGASQIGESELRGELWLLVGEALKAQDLNSIAEGYFEKAGRECAGDRKQESLLLLAQVQKTLGKHQEARNTLTKVELSSGITPRALTELISIDAKANNSQGVRTWIAEGRKSYPSEFSTSENSYNQVRAMLADGMLEDAETELEKLRKEVQEDDVWFQLSRGMVEEFEANRYLTEITK